MSVPRFQMFQRKKYASHKHTQKYLYTKKCRYIYETNVSTLSGQELNVSVWFEFKVSQNKMLEKGAI